MAARICLNEMRDRICVSNFYNRIKTFDHISKIFCELCWKRNLGLLKTKFDCLICKQQNKDFSELEKHEEDCPKFIKFIISDFCT